MARYIDADAMRSCVFRQGDIVSVYAVMEEIDNAPTADVQEVRHGEWRGVDEDEEYTDEPCYYFECSACGDRIEFGERTEKISILASHFYCPNCGAKMDGKDGG